MHSEPLKQNRRLSTKEAAAYMGISPRTLEKCRITGGGPSYLKIFDRVLYDMDELDGWLAKQRRRSTSDGGAA